jgi:hypothetical protein
VPNLIVAALLTVISIGSADLPRVRRALASLFGGAVGKDTVPVWRKVKGDWNAVQSTWCTSPAPWWQHFGR